MDQNVYFCEYGKSSDQEACLSDSLVGETAYSYQPYYSGESQQFYPVVHYLYNPVYSTTPHNNSITYYPVQVYQPTYPATVFYYGFVYYYPVHSLNPYSSPVESEYYSPSSSPVESTSSDEYEDCLSDVSESFYYTPCNSPELPSSCEEHGGYFYDETQQSFCADNTVDYIQPYDTFDSDTNGIEYLTTESLGSVVKIEEEPSTDDEDDFAFSTELAYDASSEYSDSDVEVDGLYQSYSLVDENESPPCQFLSDFYTDKDERYKKCKSRLWFFNAVSKSNCCDCYKGEKLSESGLIKKDIESCDEYKRIKETEEHTDFIKECIYTSVLKGNVRRNEKYRVDYLPQIDEIEEKCPADTAEINDETSNVDAENDPLNGSSTELESPNIEPEHPKKKFKGLKKFLARLFCCAKKPP